MINLPLKNYNNYFYDTIHCYYLLYVIFLITYVNKQKWYKWNNMHYHSNINLKFKFEYQFKEIKYPLKNLFLDKKEKWGKKQLFIPASFLQTILIQSWIRYLHVIPAFSWTIEMISLVAFYKYFRKSNVKQVTKIGNEEKWMCGQKKAIKWISLLSYII